MKCSWHYALKKETVDESQSKKQRDFVQLFGTNSDFCTRLPNRCKGVVSEIFNCKNLKSWQHHVFSTTRREHNKVLPRRLSQNKQVRPSLIDTLKSENSFPLPAASQTLKIPFFLAASLLCGHRCIFARTAINLHFATYTQPSFPFLVVILSYLF